MVRHAGERRLDRFSAAVRAPAPHVMLSTVMFVNGVRLDIELTMPDPRALFGLEPLPAVEPSSRTALAIQGSAAET